MYRDKRGRSGLTKKAMMLGFRRPLTYSFFQGQRRLPSNMLTKAYTFLANCTKLSYFDPWVRRISWRREWLPILLTWRIPWTEEPGKLQFMGSQRVRYD